MRRLRDMIGWGAIRQARTIEQKAARGVAWVGASTAADQALNTLQTMIMARLLMPQDFAIMGVAMVAVHLAIVLTQAGMHQALVQRRDISRDVLDTAWVIEVARNTLLALVLIALAWPVAAFYHEPRLRPALMLLSLRFIFFGLRNIGIFLLQREMNFQRFEIYQRVITLIGTGIIVMLGCVLRNFWALVYGQVVFGLLELIGSYIVHSYRPRFYFDRRIARELIGYGKHIFMGGILTFFKDNMDVMLLGKLLGVGPVLGYYRLARTLAVVPARVVAGPIWSVTMPTYANLQNRAAALKETFLKVLRVGLAVAFPLYAGLVLFAPTAVTLAYGDKYLPAVAFFRVFCLVFLLRFISTIAQPLFEGTGRPHLYVLFTGIEMGLFVPLMIALAQRNGAMGAAWAKAISEGFAAVLICLYLIPFMRISVWKLTRALATPALVTAAMIAILLPSLPMIGASHWMLVALISLLGAIIYVAIHAALNTDALADLMAAKTAFIGHAREGR